MKKIKNINGVYTAKQLEEIGFSVAWSGAADEEYKAALKGLIGGAQEALAQNPDAEAVEIVNGSVVATIVQD